MTTCGKSRQAEGAADVNDLEVGPPPRGGCCRDRVFEDLARGDREGEIYPGPLVWGPGWGKGCHLMLTSLIYLLG